MVIPVYYLHIDSSSLSKLPRDTCDGFLDLRILFLLLQEPWSLFCVELFCVQFSSVRRLLLPAFTSVFCGACVNLDFRIFPPESSASVDFKYTRGAAASNHGISPCRSGKWTNVGIDTRGLRNAPALGVNVRVQALERAARQNTGRRGSRGDISQGPRQEQLQRTCHILLISKRYEFSGSDTGSNCQVSVYVNRCCAFVRFSHLLYPSQPRSGPSVRVCFCW